MVFNIVFVDILRQEEIEKFYEASQKHRDFYRGYVTSRHPLSYFDQPQYVFQCPSEMSHVYMNYPPSYTKYKHPVVLASEVGRTSGIPDLPDRSLAGRYNKKPCKAYIR